ncbi:MAG: chromate efflux transporter [Pseudomonadota bacterium]
MTVETEMRPSLFEATAKWAKIGVLSFGGPAAQIALMHKVVVEENKWLSEKQFLNALNFCMLLPGPEAMQLATYAGWRIHGILGGLIAGLLFVLPGALVILFLASLYSAYGDVPFVNALFLGIKAAVLVIVVEALLKVSKRALNSQWHYLMAAFSFVGIFFLELPYPLIVLTAGIVGFAFATGGSQSEQETSSGGVSLFKTFQTILTWLTIWWLPILLLWASGADEILTSIAIFFSKLAVVTFGGAYAVLAYMAQDAVETNNWLTATQMVDGLGLAETTPGPLILVTEFVGFLAAEKVGGFWLGVVGAAVTLWVTFVPCFIWIFAGAPYIDHLSKQIRLSGALSFITAAVVGVILNLSVWFALNVLFSEISASQVGPFKFLVPELASLDWRVPVLTLLAGVLLFRQHWNVLYVLCLCAFCGFLISAL